MTARLILIGLLLGTARLPQPEIRQTPAGRIFGEWLAVFNSDDPERFRQFDASYREKPTRIDDAIAFRNMTGGFTLLRVETSEPTTIVALVQEKHSDTIARIEMTVGGGDSPKIVGERTRAISRPPDLAVPRLSETNALHALSARVNELAATDRFSGVVLVARHGTILLQKTAGRADRASGMPVTPDTRFRLGSMNKMFTSIATLQLVEAGLLTLEDPIRKHIPDYPHKDIAAKVTVRHLLTHTGGTGDIFGTGFNNNRLTLREHADYLNLYGSRGLGHEPGAEFRYSNYGFVLLGAIIERVTRASYYDHVRRAVFQPAGMTATDSLPESDLVPHRSTGYMKRDGAWVSNANTLPWRGTAAGGGYSTAGDLLKFAQALGAGRLISKTMLEDATTPHHETYGYGFNVHGQRPLRYYGHGGGAPGMNGELRVYPRLGYILVGLSNLDPPAASRVVEFFALRMPATPDGS